MVTRILERKTNSGIDALKKSAYVPAIHGECCRAIGCCRAMFETTSALATKELGVIFLTEEDPIVKQEVEAILTDLLLCEDVDYGAKFVALYFLKREDVEVTDITEGLIQQFEEDPENIDLVTHVENILAEE